MLRAIAGGVFAGALTLTACTSADSASGDEPTGTRSGSSTAASSPRTGSPSATASPSTTPPAPTVSFDAASALQVVRELAGRIGPREATSAAYREAADLVHARLQALGYDVRRQQLGVPAGVSWGVPVPAGRTANVIAEPASFAAGDPHLLVGAHLDTVPQAPGAVDNASGVAVVLELARMATESPTRLPVVLVVFAAEEPRGPGDLQHHFGSRAYVQRRGAGAADSLAGMVSLDRVGAGRGVPVCTGGLSPPRVQRELLRAARQAGVEAVACENRTSDHWPFEKAGDVVARLGGNPYAEYHSPGDRPRVVSRAQLRRTGVLVWEWVRDRG